MNIYVGNLSYEVTEEELKQLFSEHGAVVSVNLIKDRDTGNSKGFGFVEMENADVAEKAIEELNESSLKGRNMRVNQARPRERRPMGGGGGGGNGGGGNGGGGNGGGGSRRRNW